MNTCTKEPDHTAHTKRHHLQNSTTEYSSKRDLTCWVHTALLPAPNTISHAHRPPPDIADEVGILTTIVHLQQVTQQSSISFSKELQYYTVKYSVCV